MKKKNLLLLHFRQENRKKSRFLQNNSTLCIVHYELFCTFAPAKQKRGEIAQLVRASDS